MTSTGETPVKRVAYKRPDTGVEKKPGIAKVTERPGTARPTAPENRGIGSPRRSVVVAKAEPKTPAKPARPGTARQSLT